MQRQERTPASAVINVANAPFFRRRTQIPVKNIITAWHQKIRSTLIYLILITQIVDQFAAGGGRNYCGARSVIGT